MARAINKLSARQVATLHDPGRHSDGGGLYLRITRDGSRSWSFMTGSGSKRQELSLGPLVAIPLATARRLASAMREAAALGTDLRSCRETILSTGRTIEAQKPTFGTFADEYISSVEAGWKNLVHRQQWRSSLRDHAKQLQPLLIDAITTDDVLAALTPIWTIKPETAKRVQGRIEKILDAAKARGLRPRDAPNPAAWRGHLALLLPRQSKLTRGHHAALPYADAPAFMVELRQREAVAARCLEFVILTAARSGEALGATWGEIDLEAQLWTVPATRMKAGREHFVPLSEPAIELLKGLRGPDIVPTTPVFAVRGAIRSNMAMAMLLRRMGRNDITTHGFRSTFRDWVDDQTEHPRELVEHALAHSIGDKAERAYRRKTALERRAPMMKQWAEYLVSKI